MANGLRNGPGVPRLGWRCGRVIDLREVERRLCERRDARAIGGDGDR